MYQYSKYNIKATDNFNPDDFPKVVDELIAINNKIAGQPGLYKEEIIISFLKNHSFQESWISANPGLTAQFSSGEFVITHLESLFESSKSNQQFAGEYEAYIRKYFL